MTTIDNWSGMSGPVGAGVLTGMTGYYGVVTADTAAAAATQAAAAKDFQLWYGTAVLAVQVATQIAIADQLDKRARDIAKDQRDLANRQMQIGEENHARYINKFAPIEDLVADFVKNEFETNRYKPQYALQQGRAKLDADRAFGKVASRLSKKMSRYCTGANANMLRQVEIDRAKIETDAVNRAWRAEEAQMWRRDDVQLTRLQNAIANGQKLPAQAAQDMAAAAKGVAESNAIRMAGTSGFYGALAQGVNQAARFGMDQISREERTMMSGIPQIARGGMYNGSLGGSGIQYDPNSFNSFDGSGNVFNPDTAGAVNLTNGNSTGAVSYPVPD